MSAAIPIEHRLGFALANPNQATAALSSLAVSRLEPRDQITARAMRDLLAAGTECSLQNVIASLRMNDNLAAAGGTDRLTTLVIDAPAELPPDPSPGNPACGEFGNTAPVVFTDITDELENPILPVFMVDPVMEDCTTGGLFGESTAGKSFAAVSIACSVATGTPWAGHEVKRPGPVAYFAGEGRRGIPRRANAWQQYHGITIPKGRFYLPRTRVQFDAAGARLIADAIEALPEPPVLIVIDTVARFLPAGSDENSAKDMGAFINAIDALRDRFNCVVILVHHTGHSVEAQGRARGSSAFRAAMDWEVMVDKRKQHIRWTKMKDAELPAAIGFNFEQVGDSAVVVYGDAVKITGPELTKGEELGLSTLQDTCDRLGRSWATVEEWRVDYYRRHTGDNNDAKRVAFHRSREGLVAKHLVVVDNDCYRPSVTSVTNRNNVTPVTAGVERNKRNTPHRGVTSVTPLDPVVDVTVEVLK